MKTNPDPIDVAVGARVRQFRALRGISQAQLAGSVGITFQQVQKYEKGTNRISASRLHQFARIFGIPVAKLFPPDDGTAETGQDPLFGLAREDIELARAAAGLPAGMKRELTALFRRVASTETGASPRGDRESTGAELEAA